MIITWTRISWILSICTFIGTFIFLFKNMHIHFILKFLQGCFIGDQVINWADCLVSDWIKPSNKEHKYILHQTWVTFVSLALNQCIYHSSRFFWLFRPWVCSSIFSIIVKVLCEDIPILLFSLLQICDFERFSNKFGILVIKNWLA